MNKHKTVSPLTLLLCASLSLSACNQNTDDDQTTASTDTNTAIELDDVSEKPDVPSPIEEHSAEPSLALPDSNTKFEQEAVEPNEQTNSETSTSSLVEDLGFSGTELEQTNTDIDKELFCLSESTQTETLSSEVCELISNRLSSVKLKACRAAKLKASGCSSVKGFPIVVREFAPVGNRIPKGRILIVGGTHGDELTSVSVTLRWIEKLNQYHSGLYHWHIAPLMNPDGVLKPSATRTNHNGVDLNRNMPSIDWPENAIKYWTHKGGKDPRKFPGDEPASEPETKWLIDEINTFKPDAIISVHAPYGVVDFDSLVLNSAPKSLGKLHLNLLGTYPGSLGNYAGINRNIPVITLELPHSWVMPSEQETTKIWEDLVSWLQKNVDNKEFVSSND